MPAVELFVVTVSAIRALTKPDIPSGPLATIPKEKLRATQFLIVKELPWPLSLETPSPLGRFGPSRIRLVRLIVTPVLVEIEMADWLGGGNMNPSTNDPRNADRFGNFYGAVIGGIERLDLAAGQGLVDRELERPAGICGKQLP